MPAERVRARTRAPIPVEKTRRVEAAGFYSGVAVRIWASAPKNCEGLRLAMETDERKYNEFSEVSRREQSPCSAGKSNTVA